MAGAIKHKQRSHKTLDKHYQYRKFVNHSGSRQGKDTRIYYR